MTHRPVGVATRTGRAKGLSAPDDGAAQPRRAFFAAVLVTAVVSACGAAVGYSSISTARAARTLHGSGAGSLFGTSLFEILLQNLGVLAFLYSGVLTLGLTSVLSVGMVSAYVGATMAVGASNVGLSSLTGHAGTYAVLEFSGCVLAGAAGLYPALAALEGLLSEEAGRSVLWTYACAVRTSLKTLTWAAALVLVAASIETVVIAAR